MTTVTTFVRRNRGDLKTTLARSNSRADARWRRKQKDMAETLDLLPLVGQNIWQTYDPRTKRLRIRFDLRNTGPLSSLARYQVCKAFGLPALRHADQPRRHRCARPAARRPERRRSPPASRG